MICIIGANGNMGKRYQAVCKHLEIPYEGLDVDDPLPVNVERYTHYLIATPTKTHDKILRDLCVVNTLNLKILCEKPISRNNVEDLLDFAEKRGHEIYMVNQYAYYSHRIYESSGETYYHYYNSGGDGIEWDCIQLLYLAKGNAVFSNSTPIWKAQINGVKLDREVIDLCYVQMIHDFYENGAVYGKRWGRRDIIEAHKKVIEYGKSIDRDSGKIYFD